jgi:hypothetical protein
MNYEIHRREQNEKLQRLGGSEDLAGAHALAAAWFGAAQQLYPTVEAGVAIYDDTGAIVASISWVQDEA